MGEGGERTLASLQSAPNQVKNRYEGDRRDDQRHDFAGADHHEAPALP
jgi:hypothetical protein